MNKIYWLISDISLQTYNLCYNGHKYMLAQSQCILYIRRVPYVVDYCTKSVPRPKGEEGGDINIMLTKSGTYGCGWRCTCIGVTGNYSKALDVPHPPHPMGEGHNLWNKGHKDNILAQSQGIAWYMIHALSPYFEWLLYQIWTKATFLLPKYHKNTKNLWNILP